MKKSAILLAFAIGIITVSLQAQTEKGKLFLHGSSEFGFDFGKNKVKSNGTTTDNYKYSDFNFKPMAGYTVIDNMPVGMFFDVDCWRTKWIDSDNKYRGTTFLVGPFMRYYPVKLGDFKPVAEIGTGFGASNNKYNYGDTEEKDKSSYFYLWAGVGGTYFPTDYMGIDAMIGFERESYKFKASESQEAIRGEGGYTDICSGLYFRIGLIFMIVLTSSQL
jgi:hypothetical protein